MKYTKPVRLAVYAYGFAPEDGNQAEYQEQEGERTKPHFQSLPYKDEITFVGISEDRVPRSIRRVIA